MHVGVPLEESQVAFSGHPKVRQDAGREAVSGIARCGVFAALLLTVRIAMNGPAVDGRVKKIVSDVLAPGWRLGASGRLEKEEAFGPEMSVTANVRVALPVFVSFTWAVAEGAETSPRSTDVGSAAMSATTMSLPSFTSRSSQWHADAATAPTRAARLRRRKGIPPARRCDGSTRMGILLAIEWPARPGSVSPFEQ
jgi:hypothetical protein